MTRHSLLVITLLAFMLLSVTTLFSIGRQEHFEKQLIFWVVGWAIFLSSFIIRYQPITRAPFLYILAGLIFCLLVVNLFLPNKSWLNLGGITIQPSELARLPFLIILAGIVSRSADRLQSRRELTISFLVTLPFMAVIMLQPDFGMMFVYLATWLLVIANFTSPKRIFQILILLFLIAVIAWVGLFKPYQKERLLTFVFPDRDPLGSGYNLKQVKIAVGSAGWWGQGFGQGTQGKLGFLPSAETDFLLASFIEEWGVIGFAIYSALVFLFLYSLLRENELQADPLAQALGVILVVHFAFRFLFTTAVNLAVAPIVGVPTPFLTAGGSHLITDMLLLATWRSGRV